MPPQGLRERRPGRRDVATAKEELGIIAGRHLFDEAANPCMEQGVRRRVHLNSLDAPSPPVYGQPRTRTPLRGIGSDIQRRQPNMMALMAWHLPDSVT
jgi:hypothetical protein